MTRSVSSRTHLAVLTALTFAVGGAPFAPLGAGPRGADEIFWVPTFDQALEMAAHTGRPIDNPHGNWLRGVLEPVHGEEIRVREEAEEGTLLPPGRAAGDGREEAGEDAGREPAADAAAPPTLATVTPPPPIDADEPRLEALSLRRAALSLDRAALSWQKERRCGTCHTNFAYLVARPALASVTPPSAEVRSFFESMVLERWEAEGPRGDWEVVCAAVTLALNDRRRTGELHDATRAALDRMLALQRDDGGWNWLICGWPPMESDEHYGVTFAAIGLGAAPGGYAESEPARQALDRLRRWLRQHPAPSLHHRAMLLWASQHVGGILAAGERARIADELLAAQLPDGGWAVAGLLAGWKEHRRKDDRPQITGESDGYGTGFAAYVLRLAGTPADDPRIARARRWLETNQRQSGRWFTPSPTRDSEHFISNAGTAFAALALEACGALGAPAAPAPAPPDGGGRTREEAAPRDAGS